MKADVSYNDLIGTVAADISDSLGGPGQDNLKAIAKYFELNEERFEIIGFSIYGTDFFSASLICLDRERSSNGNRFIINMTVDREKSENIINKLFKRLHILFEDNGGLKLENVELSQETRFSDFH